MERSFKKYLEKTKESTKKYSEQTKHSGIRILFILRKGIYYLVDNKEFFLSRVYNILIVIFAIFSVIPLFLTETESYNSFFEWIVEHNSVWVIIFIVDYFLRWLVADFSLNKGWKSFLIYPISVWAIIDLLGIIPFILNISALRILATFRLFRVIRIFPKLSEGFKSILYSVSGRMKIFLIVLITLIFFIVFGGLIMFQLEGGSNDLGEDINSSINSYFDAVWFVFITITTIGYGDIYPATELGRVFTSIFSMVGIGMISVITALLAAGFSEISLEEKQSEEEINFDTYNYVTWVDDFNSYFLNPEDQNIEKKFILNEEENSYHESLLKNKKLLEDDLNNLNYIEIYEKINENYIKITKKYLSNIKYNNFSNKALLIDKKNTEDSIYIYEKISDDFIKTKKRKIKK